MSFSFFVSLILKKVRNALYTSLYTKIFFLTLYVDARNTFEVVKLIEFSINSQWKEKVTRHENFKIKWFILIEIITRLINRITLSEFYWNWNRARTGNFSLGNSDWEIRVKLTLIFIVEFAYVLTWRVTTDWTASFSRLSLIYSAA